MNNLIYEILETITGQYIIIYTIYFHKIFYYFSENNKKTSIHSKHFSKYSKNYQVN